MLSGFIILFELLCLLLLLSICTQINIEFTNLNFGIEYSPGYVYCLFTKFEFTATCFFFSIFLSFLNCGRVGGAWVGWLIINLKK